MSQKVENNDGSQINNQLNISSNEGAIYLTRQTRFSKRFLASLRVPQMRYPRFIFADNMEDKGIEMERAQNFQKLLIDRLKNYDPSTYQMIYTTSYITEDLENSDLVVGEYYSKVNPSLKNIPRSQF